MSAAGLIVACGIKTVALAETSRPGAMLGKFSTRRGAGVNENGRRRIEKSPDAVGGFKFPFGDRCFCLILWEEPLGLNGQHWLKHGVIS
jgi:hypothetical protein